MPLFVDVYDVKKLVKKFHHSLEEMHRLQEHLRRQEMQEVQRQRTEHMRQERATPAPGLATPASLSAVEVYGDRQSYFEDLSAAIKQLWSELLPHGRRPTIACLPSSPAWRMSICESTMKRRAKEHGIQIRSLIWSLRP